MRRHLLLFALGLCAFTLNGCSENRRYITDDQGRALILHGVGVSNSAKYDPLRMPWIEEADIQRLAGWGFNLVRLTIFWDAIEPTQGEYDFAYLDRVAERVRWCADAGLFVVLDMHQDLYSAVFPPGDGAPHWAVRDDGHPYTQQDPWSMGYLEPAVSAAFDHFWNDPDLQDAYRATWLRVVNRFKNEPAVLGYDLMNEPFSGTANPNTFEQGPLRDMYERLAFSIHALDPDAWILIEPAIYTSSGWPSYLGPVAGSRLVYAPHLYPLVVQRGTPYSGPEILEGWKAERAADRIRLNAPLLLGEFGTFDNVAGHDQLLRDILSMMEEIGTGWAIWSYDLGESGRQLLDTAGNERGHLDHLVRTYPQRIAGAPVSRSYDPDTRVLELTFREKEKVSGPTEIYIPEARLYPSGWVVEVSDPAGSWSSSWDADREILSVTTDPDQSQHTIRVSPATQ
jgi:endoglycosylceramidase